MRPASTTCRPPRRRADDRRALGRPGARLARPATRRPAAGGQPRRNDRHRAGRVRRPRGYADPRAALLGDARRAADAGLDRDYADFGGNASSADQSIANGLVTYCRGEVERAMRIMRAGAWRPKWDERRGATTWLGYTFGKALAAYRVWAGKQDTPEEPEAIEHAAGRRDAGAGAGPPRARAGAGTPSARPDPRG